MHFKNKAKGTHVERLGYTAERLALGRALSTQGSRGSRTLPC